VVACIAVAAADKQFEGYNKTQDDVFASSKHSQNLGLACE